MSVISSYANYVLVIFVIIYTVIFHYYGLEGNKTWNVYLEQMWHLGVVVAVIGFTVNLSSSEREKENNASSLAVQHETTGFIEIEKLFMANYPELLPLYKEMHQHNPDVQAIKVPDYDVSKKELLEATMASVIFQNIENIYTQLSTNPDYEPVFTLGEWLMTWRVWFLSPTLRRKWQINKNVFYSKKTVEFVDKHIITH